MGLTYASIIDFALGCEKYNVYFAGRQRYFSGSKLGLTKISEKDDIPVEQCYEIISEYTPKEDYPSKYSKKLFIQ